MEDKWISENELLKITELSENIILEWIEKNKTCAKNKNGISLINLKYFLNDYPEFTIDFSTDTNIKKTTAVNHDSMQGKVTIEKSILIIKKYFFHIIIIIVLIIMIFNHLGLKNRLIEMHLNYSHMINKSMKKISTKEIQIKNTIQKVSSNANSKINSCTISINTNRQKLNSLSGKIEIMQKQVTVNKALYKKLLDKQIKNNVDKINNLSNEVNLLQNNMRKLSVNKNNKEIVLPKDKLPIINE
jgi:hypothetical protein